MKHQLGMVAGWGILLLVSASACLSAQVETKLAQPLRCSNISGLRSARRLPSVRTRDTTEACRALALSVSEVAKLHREPIDSAIVWRHEFPVIGTRARDTLYQVGLFVHARPYVEVIVDKKSWRATVQFLEGRPTSPPPR